jgi:hypothetical protein
MATDIGQTGAQLRQRLTKLLAMLGSDQQGEVLNAVRAASKLLHELSVSWTELANATELGLSDDPSVFEARYRKLDREQSQREWQAYMRGEQVKREAFKRDRPDEYAKQRREAARKRHERNQKQAQELLERFQADYLLEDEIKWLTRIAKPFRPKRSIQHQLDDPDALLLDQVAMKAHGRKEWDEERGLLQTKREASAEDQDRV